MMTSWGWRLEAACRKAGPELWFDPRRADEAKAICELCPSRLPCLWLAIDERLEAGIFGGMDPDERHRIAVRMGTAPVEIAVNAALAPEKSFGT